MEPFDENVPQAVPELNGQSPEPLPETLPEPDGQQEIPADQQAVSAEEPAAAEEAAVQPAASDGVPAAEPEPAEPAAEPERTESAPEPESAEPATEPETTEAVSGTEKDDKSFFGDIMDLLESVIVSIFVVMLVFTYLFCTADVEGTSMEPTLEADNRLLVNRIDKDYDCGDILIIDCNNAHLLGEDGSVYEQDGLKKRIVKRLIAQAGQQVDIDFEKGVVIVDGEELVEPYINNLTTRDNGAFTYPVTVPEGYIFVLGDNRYVSKDSRSSEVGFVPAENIVGKVILRISPISSFGKVG